MTPYHENGSQIFPKTIAVRVYGKAEPHKTLHKDSCASRGASIPVSRIGDRTCRKQRRNWLDEVREPATTNSDHYYSCY